MSSNWSVRIVTDSVDIVYNFNPSSDLVTVDYVSHFGVNVLPGYNCFGKYGDYVSQDETTCNQNGNCTNFDTCTCFDHYYGIECEVFECFGLLSNESQVCSSQGSCVENNQGSNCDYEYFGEQCELRNPATFWTSFGGGGGEEYPHSTRMSSADGGFIISSRTTSFTGSDDSSLLLTKFQSDGTTVDWFTNVNAYYNPSMHGYFLMETTDAECIVVVGSLQGGEDDGAFVCKFSIENGSLIWASLLLGGYSGGKDIIALGVDELIIQDSENSNNNKLIVTGYTNIFGSEYDDVFLALFFGNNGTLDWLYAYGTEYEDLGMSVYFNDTYSTAGGGEQGSFIVSGNTKPYSHLSDRYIFVMNVGLNGSSIEWTKVYKSSDSDILKSMKRTSDGGYVFTGYHYFFYDAEKPEQTEAFIAKLDRHGYMEWVSSIGTAQYDEVGVDVAENSVTGVFVVMGLTRGLSMGESEDIFLAEFDMDGEFENISIFYNNNDNNHSLGLGDRYFPVLVAPDGGSQSYDGNIALFKGLPREDEAGCLEECFFRG